MQKNVQKTAEETVAFEEMEQVEEFGSGMDYVNGVAAGLTIVYVAVALT